MNSWLGQPGCPVTNLVLTDESETGCCVVAVQDNAPSMNTPHMRQVDTLFYLSWVRFTCIRLHRQATISIMASQVVQPVLGVHTSSHVVYCARILVPQLPGMYGRKQLHVSGLHRAGLHRAGVPAVPAVLGKMCLPCLKAMFQTAAGGCM